MTLARTVRTWGEMIKFSHSIFALPFALIAMTLAARGLPDGRPAWGQIALIVGCMIAARSFAMTFNRIADAAIDARNPRTANRPIPAGSITRQQAWAFMFVAALCFVGLCAGFLAYDNRWPLKLCLPVLALLASYSYAKRFTSTAHFILGAAIGFAPLAAWIAINPATLGLPAVLLASAVMFWIAGFDLIYACQDIAIDRRDGLFSIPSRLGPAAALALSRTCHIAAVALLAFLGRSGQLGPIYYAGLAAVALLLIAEQSVVRPNDFSRVNLAFFTINGIVSVLFAAAAITDILLHSRR